MPIVSGGGGGGSLSGVVVSGTAASGQVPVASSSSAGAWKYPPGFEIGYDQITAPVSNASSTESAGTTVISCAAHTFDGGAVLAHFSAPYIQPQSTAGGSLTVCLFEASTQIGRLCIVLDSAAAGAASPCIGEIRFTPTAGSHTYTVTCFGTSNAAGAVGAGAGGTGAYVPAFMRFTKV